MLDHEDVRRVLEDSERNGAIVRLLSAMTAQKADADLNRLARHVLRMLEALHAAQESLE
jgi:hypothetical protein